MTSPSTALRSRAWVEVDLDALSDNALHVQRAVGPDVGLIPMVKSDAYGLGMVPISRALQAALPRDRLWAFGVATVAEGEALRTSGWQGRILVVSPALPDEFGRAADAGLTLGLSDLASVERWAGAARKKGRRLPFHIEIDTGMGRAGFAWADAADWGHPVFEASRELLFWEGCFTHFHSADEPELAPTDEQWTRFAGALAALPAEPEGAPKRIVHVANSAGTMRRAGFGCDLVRPGIFLYGGAVGPGIQPRPVAALRARVALVREVAPGATVGYGATYAARGREHWGTLSIGYGDGLPRALGPGGGMAIVCGQRVPIIGRISMDVTTVELSTVSGIEPGDIATLVGRDGEVEILLDEVAALCGTISYEILTGLTKRLPRLYASRDASQTAHRGRSHA